MSVFTEKLTQEFAKMEAEFARCKLIPVVVLEREEDALPLSDALIAGGLPVMEVTFRTAAAAGAIRAIAENRPEVLVGAGTVLTTEQAAAALEAGAKFIISPGLNPEVVEFCLEREVPVFPGCVTPGEMELALSLGLSTVKFFPAEASGGPAMLKALAAPYRSLKFMPTGGITEENIGEYLKIPAVIGCGGSWVVKESLIKAGKFGEITEITKAALAKINKEEPKVTASRVDFSDAPLDLISLGEVMLRLSPEGDARFEQANKFEIVIGGSELNVAVGMAALGGKTAYLTKLPDSGIGRMVKTAVRTAGVDDQFIIDDKSDKARLGLYFYERGSFPRKPTVCYDRKGSSVTTMTEAEVDKSLYFSGKIFHVSGISLALGEELRKEIMHIVEKMRAGGAFITFDVNYRANLWSEEEAKKAVEEILPLVDGFFVSEETSRRLMQRTGSLGSILKRYAEDYGLTFVATTKRQAVSAEYHHFSSLLYSKKDDVFFTEPAYENIRIVDRVGSGDAYLSGVLYALTAGKDLREAVSYGNAMAAIKCTVPGDMIRTTLGEVETVIAEHRGMARSEMNR